MMPFLNLRVLFSASILFVAANVAQPALSQETGTLTVQAKAPGGSNLNRARVCITEIVENRGPNPCDQGDIQTSGAGLAIFPGIEVGKTVAIDVHPPDGSVYTVATRQITFQIGTPVIRIFVIGEERPPSTGLSPVISRMDINGTQTNTTLQQVSIFWATTGNNFDHYRLSEQPDLSDASWIWVSPRSQGTAPHTLSSSVDGRTYTVYLQVRRDNLLSSISAATITYGLAPTTREFRVNIPSEIDRVLDSARIEGFQFASNGISKGTNCIGENSPRVRTTSGSSEFSLPNVAKCSFEYFKSRRLAPGWRLISARFQNACHPGHLNCFAKPPNTKFQVLGPKGTDDPYIVVRQETTDFRVNLELIELLFTGPSTADGPWEAFTQPN